MSIFEKDTCYRIKKNASDKGKKVKIFSIDADKDIVWLQVLYRKDRKPRQAVDQIFQIGAAVQFKLSSFDKYIVEKL